MLEIPERIVAGMFVDLQNGEETDGSRRPESAEDNQRC